MPNIDLESSNNQIKMSSKGQNFLLQIKLNKKSKNQIILIYNQIYCRPMNIQRLALISLVN